MNSLYVIATGILWSVLACFSLERVQANDVKVNADQLHFDIVSVRPSSGEESWTRETWTDNGFDGANVELQTLIAFAYDSELDQVRGGPSWVRSSRFRVQARVPEEQIRVWKEATDKQRRPALQRVLNERFKLALRSDKEVTAGVILLAPRQGKSAVGLRQSEVSTSASGGAPKPTITLYPHRLSCSNVTMDDLATQLAHVIRMPVINQTGLGGVFNIELDWSNKPGAGGQSDDSAQGDLAFALPEQTGLRIKQTRLPVTVITILKASKPEPN